ncbi:MAG: HAD-IIIA family hydrolase [Candidatus Woesearchaeota archaeon]|jgi:D-glycero-D-manno-heptose 1,7-bisphosphate phosphatase
MRTNFSDPNYQKNIIAVATDIRDISKFSNYLVSDIFVTENFTLKEIKYCFSKSNPSFYLARIYGIKEAVIKTIGNRIPLILIEIHFAKNSIDVTILSNEPFSKDNYNVSLSRKKTTVTCAVVRTKQIIKKVLFFDRDGVLNEDVGFAYRIEQFKFVDGIVEVLSYLKSKDYLFIVVTNQGAIADGKYTEDDMHKFNDYMQDEFRKHNIDFKKIYYCPHSKHEGKCTCRKPNIGMWKLAKKEFNLSDEDMMNSWTVGDKLADCVGGKKAGTKTILVKSNYNPENPNDSSVDYFVDDVKEIKNIILQ